MSYSAKVYKVFIASPSDVEKEREIVRSVLARWNAVHSEEKKMVLLPVGWDTHSAPEVGRNAQEYINEDILEECDILIGIFWSKVGTPTNNHISGTVEEIERHIANRKLAMLYFSKKPIPPDADLKQINKVRKLKKIFTPYSFYGEYETEWELEKKLYTDLEIKITEGKFRPIYDSDLLAKISDDTELAAAIKRYFPLVAKNLLKAIVDQKHSNEVWRAIVDKLAKSSAELRESLLFLAQKGAFRHYVFEEGYKELAKINQADFGIFISELYSINRHEFFYIYNQGLLEESEFSKTFEKQLQKEESFISNTI